MTEPNPKALNGYVQVGMRLIPLHRWDYVDKRGRTRGKSPIHNDWTRKRFENNETVKHMESGRNVGVRLGDGWAVIDYDPKNDPKKDNVKANSLIRLLADIGMVNRDFAIVKTGNLEEPLSRHYYVRIPDEWTGREHHEDYPGIEFKHTKGRQVVAAGSVHPTGGMYQWSSEGTSLADANYACPELLALFERSAPPKQIQGTGEDTWGGFSAEQIGEALEKLDPCEFRDHESWLTLMQACHWASAGAAVDEWVDWCVSDPEYANAGEEVRLRWNSLSHSGSGNVVKAGYLFKMLRAAGVDDDELPVERPEVAFKDFSADEFETHADFESEEARVLREMNSRHAFVLIEEKGFYLHEKWDEINKVSVPNFVPAKDFREMYRSKKISVAVPRGNGTAIVEKTWAEFWMDHPQRREYNGVTFEPDMPTDIKRGKLTLFNEWSGWVYDDEKRGNGDWSNFKKMIKEVICANDEQCFDYVLKWMAYSVQQPRGPIGVALVIRGDKGIGKSLFAKNWARMFGVSSMITDNAEDLFGRFNANSGRCIAFYLDEAFWAGRKDMEGQMKARLTESTIRIEQKFLPQRWVPNHAKVVMTTNEDWVVPATADERRYMVLDANPAYPQNDPFFGKVVDEMENGGREAMFYDLRHMNIRGFDPRKMIRTKALGDQVRRTIGSIADWWTEILQEGEIPHSWTPSPRRGVEASGPDWKNQDIAVSMTTLMEMYKSYEPEMFGDMKYRFRDTFASKLSKIVRYYDPGRRLTVPKDDSYGNVKTNSVGQCQDAIMLPRLDECRARAKEVLGASFYEDDEDDWEIELE